jgi:hypothetical protein
LDFADTSKEKINNDLSLETETLILNWENVYVCSFINTMFFSKTPRSLEVVHQHAVRVFPNPTTSFLNIDAPISMDQIKVFDLLRKIVLKQFLVGGAISNYRLFLGDLNQGVYMIQIEGCNMIFNEMVIKN